MFRSAEDLAASLDPGDWDIIVAGAFVWESANFSAPGPAAAGSASETVVLVKPGMSPRGISDALKTAGVIENSDLFLYGVRLRRAGDRLKAG